ncbi:hypothetical protein, partial [Acinetobacter baumannii]|uniref:hypothetical protein n=1 Tax=Acinetobacter baumannii TaxID=470 RepID=UPI001BB46233
MNALSFHGTQRDPAFITNKLVHQSMQAVAPHIGLRFTAIAAKCLAVAALSLTALSVRADDIVD